ncbi:hypothetical protein ACN27G_10300 [Plantactinospora sp. WMMB334]|uniref:hypothetical protein n=1 Tax=Plantactinospora sp. WMMB334 TaxID=3404119 RepID=UPI003B9464D8
MPAFLASAVPLLTESDPDDARTVRCRVTPFGHLAFGRPAFGHPSRLEVLSMNTARTQVTIEFHPDDVGSVTGVVLTIFIDRTISVEQTILIEVQSRAHYVDGMTPVDSAPVAGSAPAGRP